VSLRNIRRDAIKKLEDAEKAKTVTEDDKERGKKTMDDLTKEFTDKIESAIKHKSDEIMKD
jgi:ribosome recycling factor